MASDFGATYSEMEGAATKLRDGKSSVDDTLDELQGIIYELVQEGFKTEHASGAYADAYKDLTTSLKDASVAVEEMADALDKMAQKIQEEDANMAGGA